MDILTILGLVMRYGPIIGRIMGAAGSNADVVTKIDQLAPDVKTVLKDIGEKFFPKATPEAQIVGAAVAINPNSVIGLQTLLNEKLGAGLIVDGIMGKATRDAISKFQAANGLVVDGVAGKNTQTALSQLMKS